MWQTSTLYQSIEARIGIRTFKILRYLVAGGTAALSHLLFLYIFVEYGGIEYVTASNMGFVCAILVSFLMQKFLTFQDRPTHDMHAQFLRYLIVTGANLALNTLLMYVLVGQFGVWYMLAQLFTTTVVAVTGYIGYTYFVFRTRTHA